MRSIGLALLLAFVAACPAGPAPMPTLRPHADEVRVGKSDPDPSCRDLGTIEATHGDACGGYGHLGSYAGAYALLRNIAVRRGATYVRIDMEVPPHAENGCADNRYVIRGVAFACAAP